MRPLTKIVYRVKTHSFLFNHRRQRERELWQQTQVDIVQLTFGWRQQNSYSFSSSRFASLFPAFLE